MYSQSETNYLHWKLNAKRKTSFHASEYSISHITIYKEWSVVQHKPLRKHAYSNILKISPRKKESFQIKFSIFFIFLLDIDCGYSVEPPCQGGSNEYPQSMFLSRKKKNNVYPCKLQFYYIKVGFKGSKLFWYVFVMIQKCLKWAA